MEGRRYQSTEHPRLTEEPAKPRVKNTEVLERARLPPGLEKSRVQTGAKSYKDLMVTVGMLDLCSGR